MPLPAMPLPVPGFAELFPGWIRRRKPASLFRPFSPFRDLFPGWRSTLSTHSGEREWCGWANPCVLDFGWPTGEKRGQGNWGLRTATLTRPPLWLRRARPSWIGRCKMLSRYRHAVLRLRRAEAGAVRLRCACRRPQRAKKDHGTSIRRHTMIFILKSDDVPTDRPARLFRPSVDSRPPGRSLTPVSAVSAGRLKPNLPLPRKTANAGDSVVRCRIRVPGGNSWTRPFAAFSRAIATFRSGIAPKEGGGANRWWPRAPRRPEREAEAREGWGLRPGRARVAVRELPAPEGLGLPVPWPGQAERGLARLAARQPG